RVAVQCPARVLPRFADVPRFAAAGFGQLVYLIGHDRESAAVNAGARGLDRRVERQQVRLVCDETDRLGESLDLRGDLPQPSDLGGAFFRRGTEVGELADGVLRGRAHPVGRLFHLRARLARAIAGGGELRGAVLQLSGLAGGGADQRRRLSRAVTRPLRGRGNFFTGGV